MVNINSTYICNTLFTHELKNMFAALLLKAGQRTIPFDVFKDLWGFTVHFNPQNVFIFRRFASWGCFVHCISKSPDH